jgi:hypothetical protein
MKRLMKLRRVNWKKKEAGHYAGLIQQHLIGTLLPTGDSISEVVFPACHQLWGQGCPEGK